MIKFLFKSILIVLILLLVIVGAGGYYINKTLTSPIEFEGEKLIISVPENTYLSQISDIVSQNTQTSINPTFIRLYSKIQELQNKPLVIQPGAYEINKGDSVIDLIQKLNNGDRYYSSILLIEGWNLKQIKSAFASKSDLKQNLPNKSDEEILKLFGAPQYIKSLEGLIHPNTYMYTPGNMDIDILRVAYKKGMELLNKEWESRSPNLPLKNSYEALILASIIEKETGKSSDRKRIAGVFINRLNKDMLLQTDPTVIYGMGDKYQGKIRKIDLQTDTPWNTYTRKGLPPTPIASPGLESIQAALHPEEHEYLYFVSRGDGTSAFAKSLAEHNKNVTEYILKKK